MKSQSDIYWNNSEARTSTLIVPLKATLWIQYPPILTNLYSTLTITRLLHFGKPKDLDLWHQTASPWPEVIKRLQLIRPSLGHLANPDFLKEGTVVTCPASEPRLHILKPYSAFLLLFAQHCKWQKARWGLQAQIATATYVEVLKHSGVPRESVRRGRCKTRYRFPTFLRWLVTALSSLVGYGYHKLNCATTMWKQTQWPRCHMPRVADYE